MICEVGMYGCMLELRDPVEEYFYLKHIFGTVPLKRV
jgi:hypothetical protein